MMKTPFFSIATPCFNSEATIERTIKSVLMQDFENYEYIIVDGGSTDGTIDIIKKYVPLFEGRMKWKSEPDKGLYDAFNKGVERSSGIYCWNVNSDDFIEDGALTTIYNYIHDNGWSDLPVVSGNMRFISKEGKELYVKRNNPREIKRGFCRDFIGINHPATLVPKDIYNKCGAFDLKYKIIGDADWYHRIYQAGVKIVLLDAIITNMSDGGVSNQFNYKKYAKDRIYYLRKNYSTRSERVKRFLKWNLDYLLQKYTHFKNYHPRIAFFISYLRHGGKKVKLNY